MKNSPGRLSASDAGGVFCRIAADLDRMADITPRPMLGHAAAHVFGIAHIDRGDHRHPRIGAPTQQVADRHSDGFPEDVPAGHVQRGLGMLVPQQRLVHRLVDPVHPPWIPPQQMRCDLGDAGPDPEGMRGDIDRAEGRAFAPPVQAVVGRDADDGRVEAAIFAATRQRVDPARIRQFDLEHVDFVDCKFGHGCRLIGGWSAPACRRRSWTGIPSGHPRSAPGARFRRHSAGSRRARYRRSGSRRPRPPGRCSRRGSGP